MGLSLSEPNGSSTGFFPSLPGFSPYTLRSLKKCLADGKAEDIVVLDIRGKSSMADYLIIASGTSQRHLNSLAQRIGDYVRGKFNTHALMEGQQQSDWVLVDLGDVIVHLFRPEARRLYNLEKFWGSD